MILSRNRIILASTSRARRTMLENAGLWLTVIPPAIDEETVKASLGSDIEPADTAMILAQTKAISVSEANQDALVVGADQVLIRHGRVLNKPRSPADARDQLLGLRGKVHTLATAVACARDGSVLWSHEAEAQLRMRNFSTDFLGAYLSAAEASVVETAGGYKLEGLGIQLFEAIDGDYFTILGLPLLPLLAFLREQGDLLA